MATRKKTTAKKTTAKKAATKKTAAKRKVAAKKAAPKRKVAARKTTAKKAAPKRAQARKTGAAKATAKKKTVQAPKTISQRFTAKQTFRQIADQSDLTIKQVEAVFDSLKDIASAHLQKKGAGEFILPKLGVKLFRSKRKATKKRMIQSPTVGQVMVPAKKAHSVARVSALKALKDMVTD